MYEDFKEFMIRNLGNYLDYKPIKNLIELKKNCLPLKFSQQLINEPVNFFENKQNYNEIKKYKIIMNENHYMLYACYHLSSDKVIAKIRIKSKNTSIFLKKTKISRHFAKSSIVFP